MPGALILAVLAVAGARAETDARGEAMTLAAALERALAANPSVRAAALEVQRAEESVSAARTRYLPGFSLEAQAGKLLFPVEMDFPQGAFGTVPGVGEIPARDTTVRSSTDLTLSVSSSISQPITQLFKTRERVHLARTSADAKREELRAQRAAVIASVKRAYYQILAGQTALAAAEEQVAAQREIARNARELVAREAALEHDELQARSDLAQAQLQTLSLRNNLDSAKEQLNRLLGRDVRAALRVAEVPEEDLEEIDLATAREQALHRRPEIRQARQLVEKAEADRSVSRLEYLPDVSAFVSYTSYFNTQILPRDVAIAGLQLKWDGWDWGRRGHEVTEKSLAIEEAREQARDAEAAVLVDVGDRYRKFQEARAGLEAARLAFESLRAKAPVMERRGLAEAALSRDVLRTRAQLAQAAHDHQQAVLSLWTAKADFEKALGVAP